MEARKLTYLEKFSHSLKNHWTYSAKVACYQDCKSPEECSCRKRFVHAAEVVRWMNRKESSDSVESNDAIPNAGRLLNEIHKDMKNISSLFLVDSKQILEGPHRCVLVFGILLEQDYGHLIKLFQSAGIFDRILAESAFRKESLRNKLLEKGILDVDKIIERFEKAKWAYLSPELTLHMEGIFEGDDYVLPFCRRKRVNDKGGTAAVYHVLVQKQFVVDPDLQQALEKSLIQDPDYGDVC